MIRAIVAIDEKRGIANDQTIPWLGKIPSDTAYYRDKVRGGIVIMGYRLYQEISGPYPESDNYVATSNAEVQLRPGFTAVTDVRNFMMSATEDVWNLGGAVLYQSTLDLAEELYITQLEGDFSCTKFFPEYKDNYQMVSESAPITENGITFSFQVWRKI